MFQMRFVMYLFVHQYAMHYAASQPVFLFFYYMLRELKNNKKEKVKKKE